MKLILQRLEDIFTLTYRLMKLSGNKNFEVNLEIFMSDAFTKRPAKFNELGFHSHV